MSENESIEDLLATTFASGSKSGADCYAVCRTTHKN
ncbi:hypothetical protein HCH_04235 [Hahella chejuensis KCTC 2396]|uniref:Uncharacterized protein n=1 Tax=Hahella chejuensis (strain KCTC 2396) TaxID=349521 RepID=Q2SEI2_HAHCH|nr:hypothetical protein HCH_04235 [Hahella chejuensis KCTC 2396]